jgi:hypothetical protein
MVSMVLRSLVLVSLLLSAGPALAQSYTRVSLLKFIDDATAGLDQANKVYKDHKSLHDDVLAQTSTRYAVPYPEMGQKVREMGTRVRSIKVNQGILEGKRSQVDLVFGADEEVFTDDRRYRDVRTMVRTLQLRADLINADWEVMKILDKEFNTLVRKHGIEIRPASSIVDNIEAKKADRWTKMDDAKKKAKDAKQWAAKGACEPAAAEALASLFSEIETAWESYKGTSNRLRDSFKARKYVCEGPGIAKLTVWDEIEAAWKDSKAKHDKFKQEYKVVEAQVKASLKDKMKKR